MTRKHLEKTKKERMKKGLKKLQEGIKKAQSGADILTDATYFSERLICRVRDIDRHLSMAKREFELMTFFKN